MASKEKFLSRAEIWKDANENANPSRENTIMGVVIACIIAALVSSGVYGWQQSVERKADTPLQITRGR